MFVKKMKRPAALLLVISLLFSITVIGTGAASQGIALYDSGLYASVPIRYDGKLLSMDKSALLIDGTTYIPLQAFCSVIAPGGSTLWDEASRTATYTSGTFSISAALGENYIVANGRYLCKDQPVRMMDDSIYIPVRTIAMAFGFSVEWVAFSRSVDLWTGTGTVEPGETYYDSTDLMWLARLIHAESCGEPMIGKIAVGNVVLNRVRSGDFPDTVHDVIFDTRWGVAQFSTINYPTLYVTPNESCYIAAKICLDGYSVSTDALYFVSAAAASGCWAERNRPYLTQIGNHVFYS